jgi:NDP-sugar pyrophosphorylase family protein
MVSIVYMVAGMSSRFNGQIKQFAKIGPNDETLIEISLNQAKNAGFSKIIFVVGEKTFLSFKEKFKASYLGIPIFYAFQSFDPLLRDRPYGTVDALVSAKDLINEPFVVCNGDDIYGENSFKLIHDSLLNSNENFSVGYSLGLVLPDVGKTNRGIFKIDSTNFVISIDEIFDIEKNNLNEKNLSFDSLCSMNLFGLQKNVLIYLKDVLDNFKFVNKDDRKIECLLPKELGNLIDSKKIKMKLLNTSDQWFGVTNPDDEKVLREIFSKKVIK